MNISFTVTIKYTPDDADGFSFADQDNLYDNFCGELYHAVWNDGRLTPENIVVNSVDVSITEDDL